MNNQLKDPDEMSVILGNALKIGVILSAVVIAVGATLFLLHYSNMDAETFLAYNSHKIPHGNFNTSLSNIAAGLFTLNAFSIIELGLLILLATPVVRVFLSILLFYFEGDIKYVYITMVVFIILLFSLFVVPLIPNVGG